MVSSLLNTLNRHATKTPDEIVRQLSNKGWIAGKTMTRDQYNWLCEGPQYGRVRLVQVYDGITPPWDGGTNPSTHYVMTDWNLSSVNENLSNYWFIPFEDYRDGQIPDCPADPNWAD